MKRIGIVGGGIGGLSAALSLRRAGFDVDVFEQAPQLNEVGGGISISPNGVRILQRLGLGPSLARDGVLPRFTLFRRWQDGRILQRSVVNPMIEEMFGAPFYAFHRADLQRMLASALPPERLHLGQRFAQLTDTGDGVEARFETGERVTVDILVGADGIHSAVRSVLFGEEEPDFTGCVAYRGLVPVERIRSEELGGTWLGPGAHFVHYPVAGGRLLNFVGWTEHDTWNREDWTDQVPVSRALDAFAGWHSDVREIISAADTCFIWALFGREPLPQWSVGRTTLLGDACHPMHPFMGQGGVQAIEDGAVLASCLVEAGADEIPEALQRYQALRLPRVSLLQEMSRANQAVVNAPDGPAQVARDEGFAAASGTPPETMRWLWGFDAEQLDVMDLDAVSEFLPTARGFDNFTSAEES